MSINSCAFLTNVSGQILRVPLGLLETAVLRNLKHCSTAAGLLELSGFFYIAPWVVWF